MAGDILDRFNPKIAKLVKLLFTAEDISLHGDKLHIREQKTGCSYPPSTARNLDRFKVLIPFAGHTLKWEVIFSEPDLPPDFIFGNHDLDFVPNIQEFQSLINWDSDDEASLISVFKELIQQYKEYQTDLVKQIPRMQFDCDFLLGNEDYNEYEIHLAKGSHQTYDTSTVVNILIKIPVNTESIPPYLIKDNPGEDVACLLVTYYSPEGSCHITPKLFLSPRLERVTHGLDTVSTLSHRPEGRSIVLWNNRTRALGGSSCLHIPQWGGQNGSCLMDYLPIINQLLKQKVYQVGSGYNKRKECVSAFLSDFGGSILEYDAETYHELSLLLKVQGFFCIVHVTLSVGFPLDKPVFVLKSIYHESNGVPYSTSYKDYPYSPRWPVDQMVDAARSFLLEKIPEFKESSLSNGKF